jgi:hypothetical protein
MKNNARLKSSADIIGSLAQGLAPVKPASVVRLSLYWMGFCIVNFALLIFLLGFDESAWMERLTSANLFEAALMFLSFTSGAMALYTSAIPGHRLQKFSLQIFVVLTAAWISSFVSFAYLEMKSGEELDFSGGFPCFRGVLLFVTLPSAMLYYQVKKLYPTRPLYSSALAVFVPFLISGLVFQFHCPDTSYSHVLAWHFSPLLLLLVLSATIGGRLLSSR